MILLAIAPLYSPVLTLLLCFYTLLLNPSFMAFIAGLLLVMTMDVASPPFWLEFAFVSACFVFCCSTLVVFKLGSWKVFSEFSP